MVSKNDRVIGFIFAVMFLLFCGSFLVDRTGVLSLSSVLLTSGAGYLYMRRYGD